MIAYEQIHQMSVEIYSSQKHININMVAGRYFKKWVRMKNLKMKNFSISLKQKLKTPIFASFFRLFSH